MTDQFAKNMSVLDDAAERAGGYVMPRKPDDVDKKAEAAFTRMRLYCLKNNKKMDKLTDDELKMLGCKRAVLA